MQKKIKDIEVGDLVKSWDFDKEKIVPAEVLKLWKHKNDKQCYKLNNKLTITGSHQVYTKDGYKLTKDIKVGDKLLGSDGRYVKVKSFKLHELDVPYVHNLTVKINNYFADGVLVHNAGAGGVWGKAGNWHGKDSTAQAAIDGLKDSLVAYGETESLMKDSIAQQTGDIGEKLELQRKELSTEFKQNVQAGGRKAAQESQVLETKMGRTGIANIGNETRRAIQIKRQNESADLAETVGVKGEGLTLAAQQEKDALKREADKQSLEMKQGLRGAITSARGQVLPLDDEWSKDATGSFLGIRVGAKGLNPFRNPRDPQSMLDRYAAGDEGFSHYCVVPNTKIEMWSSNG